MWLVFEVVGENDVLVGEFGSQKEASEKAQEYGNFESGDPCAWYKQAAG
jgi:hypothetical protein